MPVPPPEPGAPPPRPRFDWRRIVRSPRGAASLAVIAAALLLWPFAGFSWIPWMIGLGALVVLRLLRLEGLLRGWDLPLAFLVVVIGLMVSTGPWAWALAGSIGVLLAGLTQLPWWRLAAVGAVLCAASGIGFGFSVHQDRIELSQIQAQAGDLSRAGIAEESGDIVPTLVLAITQSGPDPDLLCAVLTPAAEEQLAQAAGAPDCAAAAVLLHQRGQTTAESRELGMPRGADPRLPAPAALVLDGCATAWAQTAGSEIGRVQAELVDPNQRTYLVTGFAPCG
ncbi:hypothetical protein [Pseudonocardia sp. MH-G8]|uniref:hypothetical protein n=1 Tax=Pseudonocardia sp. MH-G8 TaxID=1854588 RepID=UPI00117A2A5C|nr:hypothetical protein [Pseudonocardia sp. MH-G8]